MRVLRELEQAESPAQRLVREMQNDPVRQAIEQLEQSSALRAAETLNRIDFQRVATSLVEAQSAFAAYANSQHWAETSAAIAAAHSAITRPETVDVLRRIDADLKGLVTAAHRAVVPLAEQLQSFSVAAAAAVHPLQERFQKMEAWQASLAERMAQLQNPWAIEDHLGVSMVGFARIARLHDISSGAEPFNPAGQEVFAEELGEPVAFDENQSPEDRETARIDAGMNAEIVAFPPDAYPHVLFSAGFQLRVEAVATVTTENGDPTVIPSHRPETLANWSRDARLTGEEFTTHILIARRHGGRWQTMATTTQVYFIIALAELLNGIIYVWLY
ncbi:hypothetical protein K3758_17795 (plasmid) [Sulfitobacter sp. W002]|uniref:hypothetical protein n=1 Tax=Sulfitobacter sp. W002 TaxID=2867024 RepID=UPI0021A85886|nr:hypothetical protein [Sulfitobacter sp. W002]UWR31863.1 hypothetical protein K3758_17795 [Sulfitobacter sp. W002]